jgi:hypothetical protein
MIATYGKPKAVETREYQNGFGAKFTGNVCVWDNGVSQIVLEQRFGDLKTSNLILLHSELYKLVEQRQAIFHKPGL